MMALLSRLHVAHSDPTPTRLLHRCGVHAALDAIELIASSAYYPLNWGRALSPDQTDASALRLVHWLHEHSAQEKMFGCTNNYAHRPPLDKAIRFGFLSVVRFFHEEYSEGWTTAVMNSAAAHGLQDVRGVKDLHVKLGGLLRLLGAQNEVKRLCERAARRTGVPQLGFHRHPGCDAPSDSERELGTEFWRL